LKIVAVAVVAQAIWGMARKLCTDATRIAIATLSAVTALLWPTTWGQLGLIAVAAIGGLALLAPSADPGADALPVSVSRSTGAMLLIVFFGLLIGLPILVQAWPNPLLAMADAFYRTGSLVFGGGHVVLPLLQAEVVPNGWVSNETFLAGYGAAQAVPGPLFTFSAFLGASMNTGTNGWIGGLVCLVAVFMPSFLLVAGALPFWEQLRRNAGAQTALAGVNAAVVGLLLTAFYQPVWTSAILKPADFGLALFALVALMLWKLPPWLVVFGCAAMGWLLNTTLG
jgi:chromate transporter